MFCSRFSVVWPTGCIRFFLSQPSLSEAFMTEDGNLMLTIARNMAVGLGVTVSDGTIATNGVQPLATFVFAVPYRHGRTDGSSHGALVARIYGVVSFQRD